MWEPLPSLFCRTMLHGGPLESAPRGDGSARRIGDKHKAVVEKQGQAWPIFWRKGFYLLCKRWAKSVGILSQLRKAAEESLARCLLHWDT